MHYPEHRIDREVSNRLRPCVLRYEVVKLIFHFLVLHHAISVLNTTIPSRSPSLRLSVTSIATCIISSPRFFCSARDFW